MTKDEFASILHHGRIVAEHSGKVDGREWHEFDEVSGMWLHPGEFVIKHNGCCYAAKFPLAMT